MKKQKRKSRKFTTADLEDVIKDLRAAPKGERAWLRAVRERSRARKPTGDMLDAFSDQDRVYLSREREKELMKQVLVRNAIHAEAGRKRAARKRKQVQEYMLCSNIKKRLLRRWKGTPLEVRGLCCMDIEKDRRPKWTWIVPNKDFSVPFSTL